MLNTLRKTFTNFNCEKCSFSCINKQDYTRHLSTAKHQRLNNDSSTLTNNKMFDCICGKIYKQHAGLSRHKRTCSKLQQENTPQKKDPEEVSPQEPQENTNREIIDKLVTSNTEMKEMMLMLMKTQMQTQENTQEIQKQTQENTQEIIKETLKETSRQNQENTQEIIKETLKETSRQNQENAKEMQKHTQEMQKQTQENATNLMNKVVEVLPQMGNTTNNNNNNTLNFYLTDTCKDAESIHDFTDRFIERVVEFFRGNYRDIAYKRISLPDNVRDIFYECLDENPQTQNFVQTTDVKNGVCYVKEKKKNKECEYYGEAEFVKYKDGFTKSGIRLGHAINCALLPCKSECLPMLEKDFKEKPNEEDYDEEHEADFLRDKDSYYNTTRAVQDNLMYQTIKAMNIFDSKATRDNTLTKTKRKKNGDY